MKGKQIAGGIILLLGILMIFFSYYVHTRTTEGEEEIREGQQKVNQMNKIFSLNPVSKEVGGQLVHPLEERLNEGKGNVLYYNTVTSWLKIGGILFILGGAGMIWIGRK